MIHALNYSGMHVGFLYGQNLHSLEIRFIDGTTVGGTDHNRLGEGNKEGAGAKKGLCTHHNRE